MVVDGKDGMIVVVVAGTEDVEALSLLQNQLRKHHQNMIIDSIR
jgi:hypothetical protein